MTGIEAIGAIGPALGAPAITNVGGAAAPVPGTASGTGFAELLTAGMRQVDTKVAEANALVRQFALDDSVPLHQVTFALEEARMAVELAMQVRGRLVESYRELMNMQL
ncbi:MAG: flagellar hook-basal body complex protein FliE [Sphingomonadales bacterium]|nr:flagellar hook-basal body complex protein FliE [Sphingomonadales bacterium]